MRANRPSSTAVLIARSTLLAARIPAWKSLVPPAAIEPLRQILDAATPSAWFEAALRRHWARSLMLGLERAILPGIILHYLARKGWIEAAVVAALTAGVRQVVVLGAGFDTLAWRLHKTWPYAIFFELDHPATQAPKKRVLNAATNFMLLPVDFSNGSIASSLAASPGFSPDASTFFIAEGLLMYFLPDRVRELLRDLAGATRAPAQVLLSFMDAAKGSPPRFRGDNFAIGGWLRWISEPFQWGLARTQIADFLQPLGWTAASLAGPAELRAQFLISADLAAAPLAEGECLCLATRPSLS